jgi:hypothetical protein
MGELERITEKKKKFSDFQKNYNLTSKNIVHILGTNLALFICMLLPIFLIFFIWADVGLPVLDWKLLSDGIVTIALFVIGELLMIRIGSEGGRMDNEYIAGNEEFKGLVKNVCEIGTMFMAVFCEWQIDLELDQAIAARLRTIRFNRSDWAMLKDMPYSELKDRFGRKRAKTIMELKDLEPIELNEEILLYENGNALMRGGVPLSGEAYLKEKTHSVTKILSWVFAGLLGVSVAIALTSDVSFARVVYTIFKLIVLFYRMAVGYGLGAKAYNTIEVRQLQVKSNFLRKYIRFVNDKTYLKLGDKYGDISCYVDEENNIPIS